MKDDPSFSPIKFDGREKFFISIVSIIIEG
jgi:hypothetical protein